MAAIRSALMMLGRRSGGSSGSLAASSVGGGRGLQVYQALGPAAPQLCPSTRSIELQGLHRFSTGGMPLFMKHKAQNVLRLWGQRSSDHVKNYRSTSSDDPYVKNYGYIRLFGTISGLALFGYLVVMFRAIHNHTVGSGIHSNTGIQRDIPSPYPYFLPIYGYVNLCLGLQDEE